MKVITKKGFTSGLTVFKATADEDKLSLDETLVLAMLRFFNCFQRLFFFHYFKLPSSLKRLFCLDP